MNRNLAFSKLCLGIALLAFAGCSDDEVSWPEVDGAAPKMELKTDHIRTDKGYKINVKGELADADGTISIVNAATESDADSANNIFTEDARLTEGTALRFTVESSYTEILDAGYVPKLTATTLNADNTTSTKVLYDPADDTFAELNRYLHMRFYKQTDGKDGKKKEYTTYAYTTAYPNKDYMGLVVSNLEFYARGWKEEKETGKICLTSLSMQLTVAKPDGTPVYTQTAVIPLPGAPEFQ